MRNFSKPPKLSKLSNISNFSKHRPATFGNMYKNNSRRSTGNLKLIEQYSSKNPPEIPVYRSYKNWSNSILIKTARDHSDQKNRVQRQKG